VQTSVAQAVTRRDVIFKASAAIAFAVLPAGCGLASGEPPIPTYRYRLTVEIDTPEGLRTGSSVIEVATHVASQYAIPEPGRVTWRVKGEAVAIGLPNGEVVFALLSLPGRYEGAAGYAEVAFPQIGRKRAGNYDRDTISRLIGQRGIGVVPAQYYPMLVRFTDIADPKTLEAVDPNDLAKSFGKGVKLRRIAVLITNDPVTDNIEQRLSWLRNFRNGGKINGRPLFGYDKAKPDIAYFDFREGN
jgi:hypothetical protein